MRGVYKCIVLSYVAKYDSSMWWIMLRMSLHSSARMAGSVTWSCFIYKEREREREGGEEGGEEGGRVCIYVCICMYPST